MRYFHERLRQHMEGLTPPLKYHDLQFMAEIQSGIFSAWKKPHGEKYSRVPSDQDLEKLANVKELGLSLMKLKTWRLIDQYGMDAVREAYLNEVKPILEKQKR